MSFFSPQTALCFPSRGLCLILTMVLLLTAVAVPAVAQAPAGETYKPAALQGLHWRDVGPFRGGRSAAATGLAGDPRTYYFGATGGGVWKTTDAGATWNNISDGFFGGSIGAVAVSEWDPNVIYVGGGEVTVRGNVSHGSGMWKSTDAGRTWTSIGLEDSHHIPRIRIHPRNPDLVYAAVLGHLYGPNKTRGIYRSTDGGKTWKQVLFVNEDAGAFELVMDPTNPRRLLASFWRVRRTSYSLESGGEGSGLWRSTDGGDTWTEITRKPGLPQGTVGVIGVTISASNPDNLYALVEAEDGGVFRSRDGGDTWARTSESAELRQRAWYFSRIYADPKDEEAVYVLNVGFHLSRDGGHTFTQISTPHGDHHDLWLDPQDPQRMILADDGGAVVSFDGGASWSSQNNQPTAQIYRLGVDNQFPYRLYGAQQDNSTLRIVSMSGGSGIGPRDWEPSAGGESGYVVPHPKDPEVVYGGSYGGYLDRYDHRTGERRAINVWPDNPMGWAAGDLPYRFQWNFPIFTSPHDPEVLYAAGNVLFMSTNEGQSWSAISPDLTRNDKSRLGASGGPITKDNTSVEYYGTIFTALESPHQAGVFWTGSDDGLVQLSRDFGETWQDVTPPQLPRWVQINSLEAHPTEAGGLYLAATAYKSDDFRPYLLKTTDWGKTWTVITSGIPATTFTRVVRADPERPGLLFAGTESGVYVSFNDGGAWQPLQLNLPIVPITDLAVHEGDLIAATQGRGFWILDDLSPLHQLTPAIAAKDVHLFTPRRAWRLIDPPGSGGKGVGENPPAGVTVYYQLAESLVGPKDRPAAERPEVKLEFLTSDGQLIRSFSSRAPEQPKGEKAQPSVPPVPEQPLVPAAPGLNRFSWDLTYPSFEMLPGMVLWAADLEGPTVVPGNYLVRLTVGNSSTTSQFQVAADPRITATPEALQAQFDFLLEIRDKLNEVHAAIRRIRGAREQIQTLVERLGDNEAYKQLPAAAKGLLEQLDSIENELYQTKNRSAQDTLNYPIRLNNKLGSLATWVAGANARPTDQAVLVKDQLVAAADAQLQKLQDLLNSDLPAFNQLVQDAAVPAILVPTAEAPAH